MATPTGSAARAVPRGLISLSVDPNGGGHTLEVTLNWKLLVNAVVVGGALGSMYYLHKQRRRFGTRGRSPSNRPCLPHVVTTTPTATALHSGTGSPTHTQSPLRRGLVGTHVAPSPTNVRRASPTAVRPRSTHSAAASSWPSTHQHDPRPPGGRERRSTNDRRTVAPTHTARAVGFSSGVDSSDEVTDDLAEGHPGPSGLEMQSWRAFGDDALESTADRGDDSPFDSSDHDRHGGAEDDPLQWAGRFVQTNNRRSAGGGGSQRPTVPAARLRRPASPGDGFEPDRDTPDDTATSSTMVAVPPYSRNRRTTIWGISTNMAESRSYAPHVEEKPEPERRDLIAALKKCHLLEHLEEEELSRVVDAAKRCRLPKGALIVRQAEVLEMEKHQLYVLLSGQVSSIVDNVVRKIFHRGSTFGEGQIMFIQPRMAASYRVDSDDCILYSVDAEAFRLLLTSAAVNKRELYEGFLDRIPWLSGLTHSERTQLADCLQPVVYANEEYLIEYDTPGEFFFIILSGTVDVYGRCNRGEVFHVCSFSAGDCVGELEFINNHRTVADVRANGRVKVARLHKEHFEICIGPVVDVLRRIATVDDKYAYYQGVVRGMRRTASASAPCPNATEEQESEYDEDGLM